jgi:hypothetical protein
MCTGAGNGDGGCGAKLLVGREDIYLTHHYDYGGGHDIFYTFRCPECGAETDLEERKVPAMIRWKLLDDFQSSHRSMGR